MKEKERTKVRIISTTIEGFENIKKGLDALSYNLYDQIEYAENHISLRYKLRKVFGKTDVYVPQDVTHIVESKEYILIHTKIETWEIPFHITDKETFVKPEINYYFVERETK